MKNNVGKDAEIQLEKAITVRVCSEMKDEINRIVSERKDESESTVIRGLIRDGLNYRSRPEPILPMKIQKELVALVMLETGALYYDEDQRPVFSEGVVKALGRRIRGSVASDWFIKIMTGSVLIASVCALAYVLFTCCGN